MGKKVFVDGNPSLGVLGTIVDAAFLNAMNNHRHVGLDVDGAGVLDYAVSTGSANAYVLTLSPALGALIVGQPIYFMANHTNTGAATLDCNGLGAKTIKKNFNYDLAADDIKSGQIVVAIYDGTNYQVSISTTATMITENFKNLSFTATVAAGSKAIVLTLLGEDGNAPSATNKPSIKYRATTLTDTKPVTVDSTAATTLTIPNGATLGFTANETGRFYVFSANNAGVNAITVARTADIWPESNLVTTVAIDAASDLATAMYSTDQLTLKACRCIGYVEATTGATPGEWPDNAIKKCVIMHNGVKRTGDVVQTVITETASSTNCATGTVYTTAPQITQGTEVMTADITPTSAINKLIIQSVAMYACISSDIFTLALFKESIW
jgi:hypothetical protein